MIIFFYRNSAVIRVLADILRESGKEKVTRIIIAALRVSLVKTVFEYGSFLCWILRRRRRFFLCFRRAEASARKVCEKREERERRMREWGSMGGIATPSLAPDLPFVYPPRAPLMRVSHARLSRASHAPPLA